MIGQFLFKNRSELPLKEDQANTFLEISIVVSVFLFSITLAAFFVISAMISSWNKSIVDGLSVQIMPSEQVLSADEELLRVGKVIQFFEGFENVEKVIQIKDSQIQKLMRPWLGQNVDLKELPMPKLLDVRLKNGKFFDYDKAAAQLKDVAPYASMDNYAIWLQKLVKSASSLKALSVFVLMLVLITTSFSIMYAVQTSLKIHQNIIEILHIMGATDDYIGKQYAKRIFIVALLASIIGSILSILALLMISYISANLDTGLIASATLTHFHWALLALLPLPTSLFAMLTALISVKRTLGKII